MFETSLDYLTKLDLAKIPALRDKVFQVYKRHLKTSATINNDLIDPLRARIEPKAVFNAFAQLVSVFSNWLILYINALPGFENFLREDLTELIKNCFLFNFFLHHNQSYTENERNTITLSDFELPFSLLAQTIGTLNSNLIHLIHAKLKKLSLSDQEVSLFYPMITFSCPSNFMSCN